MVTPDNFSIDVTSVGKENLAKAMSLCNDRCTGWIIIPDKGLVLCRYENPHDATKFPFPMQGQLLVDFVWGWVMQAPLGNEPDHDGSNKRGWRIYCENWGCVGTQDRYLAIQPVWAMYGK